MLLRVVVLFLIFMLVMASVQKLLGVRRERRSAMDRLRCPRCKRIQISAAGGPCGRPDCTGH